MPSHELPKNRAASAYDKSAARVRPDGSRLRDLDPKTAKAKAKADFRASHLKQPVKTSRKGKTWIAADEYEFERVPKRKRVVVVEEEEEGSDDAGEFGVVEEAVVERRQLRPRRSSTKRRRLSIDNLSFLSNANASTASAAADGWGSYANLDPSSDLLKWIHYYASRFYAASGQIINSERKYRVSRKVKLNKSQSLQDSDGEGKEDEEAEEVAEVDGEGEDDSNSEDEAGFDDGHRQGGSSDSDKSYQDGQSDHDDDNDNESDAGATSKFGKKEDRTDPSSSMPISKHKAYIQRLNKQYFLRYCEQRDMYRAFDGSALLCIGKILKAHIVSKLQAGVPESWDDEVAAYQELEEELRASDSEEDEESKEVQPDNDSDEEEADVERTLKEESRSEDDSGLTKRPPRKKRKRRRNDDLRANYMSSDYRHL